MRYFLILIAGISIGLLAMNYQLISNIFSTDTVSAEREVLYWVAPMDANYRRDKPGKSPMGMDLVAVYAQAEKAEPKILYWVAPMDASYRRDKPGNSPMGMALVPVYDKAGGDNDAGVVKISSAVENNLGVRTGVVTNRAFNIHINTLGTIQMNDDAMWQINSRVSGWIDKLYVKSVGTQVQKGDPLFDLYSPELVKAQESLFNAINLNRRALISSSKARLQALGINKEQVENIINRKKVQQNITIFAPQRGTISLLTLNEGAFISPSTLVIKAANLDTVWVDAEVFAAQVSLVKVGDPAVMHLDYFPGQEWIGKISFIYPELNPQNRTLRARLQFDNPNAKLKPNMFANVTIKPELGEKKLQVPREAVIYAGQMNRVVLALGNGRFKSVIVNIGMENKDSVEILSGLTEGQKIVTSAQFLLDSESSISADFERMLDASSKAESNSKMKPQGGDLDWLDLGMTNTKPVTYKHLLTPNSQQVAL